MSQSTFCQSSNRLIWLAIQWDVNTENLSIGSTSCATQCHSIARWKISDLLSISNGSTLLALRHTTLSPLNTQSSHGSRWSRTHDNSLGKLLWTKALLNKLSCKCSPTSKIYEYKAKLGFCLLTPVPRVSLDADWKYPAKSIFTLKCIITEFQHSLTSHQWKLLMLLASPFFWLDANYGTTL